MGQRLDRAHEVPVRIGLHDVRTGASLDDVAYKLVRKMQCQYQNPCIGKQFVNSARCLQTIDVRHAYIHDHDFRFELFSQSHCFSSGLRLATNFPSCPRSEQLFQSPAHNVVIVRYENSHSPFPQSQCSLLWLLCAARSRQPQPLLRRHSLNVFHGPYSMDNTSIWPYPYRFSCILPSWVISEAVLRPRTANPVDWPHPESLSRRSLFVVRTSAAPLSALRIASRLIDR